MRGHESQLTSRGHWRSVRMYPKDGYLTGFSGVINNDNCYCLSPYFVLHALHIFPLVLTTVQNGYCMFLSMPISSVDAAL